MGWGNQFMKWFRDPDEMQNAYEQSGNAVFDDEEQFDEESDDDLFLKALNWMQDTGFYLHDIEAAKDGMGIVMSLRSRLGLRSETKGVLLGGMTMSQITRDLADVKQLYERGS